MGQSEPETFGTAEDTNLISTKSSEIPKPFLLLEAKGETLPDILWRRPHGGYGSIAAILPQTPYAPK
jgi:hypothetical protein